ncbi:MAG: DUF808 domain-containing protein [Xanthomonadales bacterium]|nr:DUF808 domain-containing protein [Xanthomonadales bacterium]MCE7931203.1 DUF808 domain-containing protein [Xanthomonadales bacterium PRO6]
MAGSSFFALLDDIATLLDDVSVMTKVAAQKTAGVLGDDLALNAQQVAGVAADRELPVVWAVAKGSLWNKAILVPAALAVSALMPWAVIPLLMIGGLFLCFEGVEKLAHKFLHSAQEDRQHHKELIEAITDPQVNMLAWEKDKIKGAVRTDFILSAEIIVISLGTVAAATFGKQVAVLCAIALLMTVGVYGLVGGIVKLDDFGLHLHRMQGTGRALQRRIGALILRLAPLLMRSLSILGTAAMFMVGGGIVVHGVPALHHFVAHCAAAVAAAGSVSNLLATIVVEAAIGIVAGTICLALFTLGKRLSGRRAASAH